MKVLVFILLFFTILNCGCATQSKSVGLGAGIGAGTGMTIGAIADPNASGEFRTRNVIIGGMLGTVIGATAGSAIYKGNEKAREEGARNSQSTTPPPSGGAQPQLSQAKVETRWVEPKVVGNRYIEGHFEYVITEPAKWDGGQ